jgi:hypothetical protein
MTTRSMSVKLIPILRRPSPRAARASGVQGPTSTSVGTSPFAYKSCGESRVPAGGGPDQPDVYADQTVIDWHQWGAYGKSMGRVWRSMGRVCRSIGPVWRSMGRVCRSIGPVWRSMGRAWRSNGTRIDQNLHAMRAHVVSMDHLISRQRPFTPRSVRGKDLRHPGPNSSEYEATHPFHYV